ncbi:MAG: ABC transporter substrate-binding protein [Acidobacteria bacterium]|nr:ABC transporter substrate-binding protein [Acidobacteriota bacterium]
MASLCTACGFGIDRDPATLILAIEGPPITFDPRGPTNAVTARIQQLIFNTLVQKDERFELVPDLADSWTSADDATRFTFELRRGVQFHDGRELTSADVVHTFSSLIAPEFDSPKRSAFARLERIVARGRYTVEFHCRESYRSLPLDLIAVGIIPDGSGSTIGDHPVGTGPYRFVRYLENQEVDLEGFPDAFRNAPRQRRLQVRIVRDPTTLGLELLSGQVDLAVNTQLSPDFVEEQRRRESLAVSISDGASLEYLGINMTDPILSDVRVRRAISLAVDRRTIIDALLRGEARPASGVLPPGHWALDPALRPDEYRPEEARALLDQAGWPDPDGAGPLPRLRLTLKTSSAEQSRQIATILQEEMRLIGIDLELVSLEFQTYLGDINRGNFQLFYLRIVGANQFPEIFRAAFGSLSIPGDPTIPDRRRTGFLNRARYRNPNLDRLIEAAENAEDRDLRIATLQEIQRTLWQDLPWVCLWYPANVAVMDHDVENVQIPPSGDFFFISQIELRPGS